MKEAKYTEYLSEYLQNHDLPSVFSMIDGFETLFVANFCDREIGFETEDLFEIKLEAKANVVVPLYTQRLAMYETALQNAPNAKRTISESVSGQYNDTLEAGAQKSKTTELPLDETTALPSSKVENDGYTNESERNETRSLIREESGENQLEAYDVVSRLERDVYNVKRLLLKEFDILFMGVF